MLAPHPDPNTLAINGGECEGLPFDYTQEDFDRKDVELAAGLGVAVGLLVKSFHFFETIKEKCY